MDVVIRWVSPALDHLNSLGIVGQDGKVAVNSKCCFTQSVAGGLRRLDGARLCGGDRGNPQRSSAVNQVQSYLTSES